MGKAIMNLFTRAFALATAALCSAPVLAQESAPPAAPITVSGNVSVVSQYRLRGISLSDEKPALQTMVTAFHESGLYIGTFASSLAGYGSVGGANLELDAYAGYSRQIGGATIDAGLFWYFYPGVNKSNFVEIYGSVSADAGPANLKFGTYYAPKRESVVLGNGDNLYLYLDAVSAVPNTPLRLKGHIGRSAGRNAYLSGPTGKVIDWMVGVEFTWDRLTLGVSYLDTDISKVDADAFYAGLGGHDIVDGAALVSLSVGF